MDASPPCSLANDGISARFTGEASSVCGSVANSLAMLYRPSARGPCMLPMMKSVVRSLSVRMTLLIRIQRENDIRSDMRDSDNRGLNGCSR
jgi:hypothetical protein